MADISGKSYASVIEATEFFQFLVGGSIWLSADSSDKDASLVQATALLDSYFTWSGSISSDNQPLRWPRTGAISADGLEIPDDVIPKLLKDATMYLAYYLIKSGGLITSTNDIDSLKIGPITLDFAELNHSETNQLIPEYIVRLLQSLGSYTGPVSSTKAYNVKAMR